MLFRSITWDKISFRSYQVKGVVPTANDIAEFYVTPPIPVGPARRTDNPIYGGTAAQPEEVHAELFDFCDDDLIQDPQNLITAKFGRGSYTWRPWGKKE